MLDNYKDILTVNDLYEILPIGKNKIYDLLHAGDIKSVFVAQKYLILKQNVIEFLQAA